MSKGITANQREVIAAQSTITDEPEYLISTSGKLNVNATLTPITSGGLSVATGSIQATATAVKTSAGQLYGWYIYNSNSSVSYCQFFDMAVANVTLGSTAPIISMGIPATSAANIEITSGLAFTTAITVAFTTTRAGASNPSNNVDYNFWYK